MMLYFSPGACSLADHIVMHEAGWKFEHVKVDLKKHTLENGQDFHEINPKGYVPAVRFDDGSLLTENVAILSMVADKVPELMPQGPTGRYRLWEMLAFISTEIHKSFKPLFSSDASTEEKKTTANLIGKKLKLLASEFRGPYIFGEALSAADPYLFVMLTWAAKNGVTIPASLKSFMQTMTSRKATQTALKDEGLA